LERLVEILGFRGRQRTASHQGAHQRTKTAEPAKVAEGAGTGHCLGPGWGPV
jgi:hypothetical protein